jgi:hypothetical protein
MCLPADGEHLDSSGSHAPTSRSVVDPTGRNALLSPGTGPVSTRPERGADGTTQQSPGGQSGTDKTAPRVDGSTVIPR